MGSTSGKLINKVKNTYINLNSREKFEPGSEFENTDLHTSNRALYHLCYPGSIDGTGLFY